MRQSMRRCLGSIAGLMACINECPPTKRPYAQQNAQRRSIYTDAETWEAIKKLGNGNASAGIREAVKISEVTKK